MRAIVEENRRLKGEHVSLVGDDLFVRVISDQSTNQQTKETVIHLSRETRRRARSKRRFS